MLAADGYHVGRGRGIAALAYLLGKAMARRYGTWLPRSAHSHKVLSRNSHIRKECREFPTEADFLAWKNAEELKTKTRFVAHRSAGRLADGTVKTVNYCQRSGTYVPKGKGKRQLKSQGSSRCGTKCPAQMEILKQTDGRVAVIYQPTHHGHTENVAHFLLSQIDREALTGKLEAGVTMDRMLDDIRSSVGCVEPHLLNVQKKDLLNIAVEFNIAHPERLDSSDAVSIDLMARKMCNVSDSPIICYKPQSMGSEPGDKDFMLGIITPQQQLLLAELGTDRIQIDSTRGTNEYDFQLTTLMVVDEFNAGVPVAYLISNKVDSPTMQKFFEAIESKIGKVHCKVFMSDDAPAYINAWRSVMPEPEKRLLCAWHVDKNWRKRIDGVQGELNQLALYMQLRTILCCQDEDKFHKLMEGFLDKLKKQEEPTLKDFHNYFVTYYASRPTEWAYCFRKHARMNTNMRLESLFGLLKHRYMNGMCNKRLDTLVKVLMKMTRDNLMNRRTKVIKGKICHRTTALYQKHRKGLEITDQGIKQVEEDTWTVVSQTTKADAYTVTKGCNGL
ncbi:hypothetical protein HPB47_014062 [Ixodes persulcatus]|uniref:Uncharacterized protein n=1 Tax=Ixodes persulcatus TaxID=34615 RepID=A0AC60R0G5_IXOPE|nr:hypothetical protein HPB47_014062 [Ixodes persulcatus]